MSLYHQYQQLKQQQPHIRARHAAQHLGVAEGELVNACVGKTVELLVDDCPTILHEMAKVGEVMALTRNEACVHECHGAYHNAKFFDMGAIKMGLLANPDIDLRLFMEHWRYAFAVNENERKSVQFFDKAGQAVHKIYMTPKSDERAFKHLVDECRESEQIPLNMTLERYTAVEDLPDDAIDWQGFRQQWTQLRDLHDFHPLLKKHQLGRKQAYRRIGTDYAIEIAKDSPRKILQLARDLACEIMVFVGNRGCLQIYTGAIKNLVDAQGWLNVLDANFNLHLNEAEIDSVWAIKRPSDDGMIHSVELFNKDKESIALFFGKRKPGITELDLWRDIVAKVSAFGH